MRANYQSAMPFWDHGENIEHKRHVANRFLPLPRNRPRHTRAPSAEQAGQRSQVVSKRAAIQCTKTPLIQDSRDTCKTLLVLCGVDDKPPNDSHSFSNTASPSRPLKKPVVRPSQLEYIPRELGHGNRPRSSGGCLAERSALIPGLCSKDPRPSDIHSLRTTWTNRVKDYTEAMR